MLVLGGCRSGKSAYALDFCNSIAGSDKFFLATCVPMDAEMKQRVISHQAQREDKWKTVEEPVDLSRAVTAVAPGASVILVDCLTLWVSNMMAAHNDTENIRAKAGKLAAILADLPCPAVCVANEVGTGIVPENELARQFRDNAGMVNQIMARHARTVIYTVAGIPMKVKP